MSLSITISFLHIQPQGAAATGHLYPAFLCSCRHTVKAVTRASCSEKPDLLIRDCAPCARKSRLLHICYMAINFCVSVLILFWGVMGICQHPRTTAQGVAQGVLLWSTWHANWKVRCQQQHVHSLPTVHKFVTIWNSLLRQWVSYQGLSIQRSELGKFVSVLQRYLSDASWTFAPVSASRPSSLTPQQVKSRRK